MPVTSCVLCNSLLSCFRKVGRNSNINHAHFVRAGSNDQQKPIGNALPTLFFEDLRKKLERLGLAFNMWHTKFLFGTLFSEIMKRLKFSSVTK